MRRSVVYGEKRSPSAELLTPLHPDRSLVTLSKLSLISDIAGSRCLYDKLASHSDRSSGTLREDGIDLEGNPPSTWYHRS